MDGRLSRLACKLIDFFYNICAKSHFPTLQSECNRNIPVSMCCFKCFWWTKNFLLNALVTSVDWNQIANTSNYWHHNWWLQQPSPSIKNPQTRSNTCPSPIDLPNLGRNFQKPVTIHMISRILKSNADNTHRQQAFSWHYRRKLSSLSMEENKSFVYTKTSHDIIVARFVRGEKPQHLDWRCMLSDREIWEFMKRKEIWRRYFELFNIPLCCLLRCTGHHNIVVFVVDFLCFTFYSSTSDPKKLIIFSLFLSVFFFYCGCTYSTRTWPSPS